MHISKREDYAVILINTLTNAYGKKLVPLSEVSKAFDISLLFLRNIAYDLQKTGIIKAVEGRSGGYTLVKHPKDIQFGDVLTAVTKKPLFSCCQETRDGRCRAKACPHGVSLRRIHNEFMEEMSGLTLLEFMQQKGAK